MKEYLLNIICGRKKGLTASIIRIFLLFLSTIYYIIVKSRRFLYKKGILKNKKLNNKVISVGNITVGGTGKTPFTAFLIKKLKQNNNITVISRGYGAEKKSKTPVQISSGGELLCGPELSGDELYMLAEKIKNVNFIRAKDRYSGGLLAEKDGFSGFIILDDGFQHYQLDRDLDILLIDGKDPFSNKKLLPAGLLREPLSEINRADVIIITRTENLDTEEIEKLKKELKNFTDEKTPVFEAEIKNDIILTLDSLQKHSLDFIKDKKVFAFCGIGRPEAFKNSLEKLNTDIVEFITFADHYSYEEEDLLSLVEKFHKSDAEIMITTEKDSVKIIKHSKIASELPIYKLAVRMSLNKEDEFMQSVMKRLG
ncbi:MAG: tetraacyldisaccharide 4'-kinase [Bacillota bacterium]